MAHRKTRSRRLNAEMNIVPYVDVMFVLLVIFMVTAGSLSMGVDVEPPQTDAARNIAAGDTEMVVISVDTQGNFYVNIADEPDKPLADDQIAAYVNEAYGKTPEALPLVKGDKAANLGRVIDAMAILQAASGKSVSIVTESVE